MRYSDKCWWQLRSGVNFTNVLRAAFTLVDPESFKNTVKSSVSFYAFGICGRKSCTKSVDEIEPWWILIVVKNKSVPTTAEAGATTATTTTSVDQLPCLTYHNAGASVYIVLFAFEPFKKDVTLFSPFKDYYMWHVTLACGIVSNTGYPEIYV